MKLMQQALTVSMIQQMIIQSRWFISLIPMVRVNLDRKVKISNKKNMKKSWRNKNCKKKNWKN